MDDSYLVIARRYRPQLFSDVIGQDAIIRTLKNALVSGRVSHAYLFAGSRGTGKTSIARLYAKALNCAALSPSGEPCNACPSCVEITEGRSLDVQEIDGASHRGIDHIRSLTESASYAPACGRYKIILIDEVHMLTKEAFNALLKTLEEPPSSVIFFLATTEPHKIPATIISRCQRFNLRRLSKEAIVSKLQHIVKDMNVQAEEAALHRLAGYADGGLRDAESLLDQVITFSDGHIREEIVEEVFGIAPVEWLLQIDRAIATADIRVAYAISDRVFYEGKDIGHFIDDVSDHFRALLMIKLQLASDTSLIDAEQEKPLAAIAASLSQEHLLDILNLLAEAQRSLKTAASQRFLLEWLLLNIVRIQRKIPLPLIARKLFELQARLEDESSLPSPLAPAPQAPPLVMPVAKPAASCLPKPLPQPSVPPKAAPLPSVPTEGSPSAQKEKRAKKEGGNTPNPQAEEQAVPLPKSLEPCAKLQAAICEEPEKKKEKLSTSPMAAATGEEGRHGQSAAYSFAKDSLEKKSSQNRPAPAESLPEEQENARQENLIQFAAVELGATIIKTSNPS